MSACIIAAPLLAQHYSSSDDASFAPKKGQWQVSVLLGGGKLFNKNTSYLPPKFVNTEGAAELPNRGTDNSGDLSRYLNIGGLNNDSLVNIAGVGGKYLLPDNWDISFQFSMDISPTSKKDHVKGDNSIPDMTMPAQSYINAQMTNNQYTSVGSSYYLKTRNERIHPYVGGALGFRMARIEATEPYTGDIYEDSDDSEELPSQAYTAGDRAGQTHGLKVAAVAGIEYSIAKGFIFGFEMHPLAYRHDLVRICPEGFDKCNVSHHSIKIFEIPMVKPGFRF